MASPEAFALAYLGNALWQVPLVALAATGLARGLYGLSPSVQHRLALAALALAVALPLAFHPAAVPLRRLARTQPALSRFRALGFPRRETFDRPSGCARPARASPSATLSPLTAACAIPTLLAVGTDEC